MPKDPRPHIAVIDYGIGNLRSAQKALERVGAIASLTSDAAEIDAADAVVLPGVGNIGRCLDALRDRDLEAVTKAAAASRRPFLGICVGMQMLFAGSDEAPDVPGLGILEGSVRLLPESVKRPQMQWNRIETAEHPLMTGLNGAWMYFVHSYAAVDVPASEVIATCDYGGPVVAAVGKDSVWATQFHPEKSADAGAKIMENFVAAANAANRAASGADQGTASGADQGTASGADQGTASGADRGTTTSVAERGM